MKPATRVLAILCILLVFSVDGASAQNASSACNSPDAALSWWRDQGSRLPNDERLADIRSLHETFLPRFQQAEVDDAAQVCRYLDAVLDATGESTSFDDRIASAQNAIGEAETLSEGVLIQASLVATVGHVGQIVEQRALTEGTTLERIRLLGVAYDLYSSVTLDGPIARVSLWHDAEERAWLNDVERVERDLEIADGLQRALHHPLLSTLNLARVPEITSQLNTDIQIMASHGDEGKSRTYVERLETEVAQLRTTQVDASIAALWTATLVSAAAIAFVLLAQMLGKRYQEDVLDLETSLLGVPS